MNEDKRKRLGMNKLVEFEQGHTNPKPLVRIYKEEKKYIVESYERPEIREEYSSAQELIDDLIKEESTITHFVDGFKDETGEEILKDLPNFSK